MSEFKKCQSFRFRLKKVGKQWYENQISQMWCQYSDAQVCDSQNCGINHNNATNQCACPSVVESLPYCEIEKEYFYSYAMLDTRKNWCSPPNSGVNFYYVTPTDEFCMEYGISEQISRALCGWQDYEEWLNCPMEDPNTCQVFPRHDVRKSENSWLRQTLEAHENWLTTLLSDV